MNTTNTFGKYSLQSAGILASRCRTQPPCSQCFRGATHLKPLLDCKRQHGGKLSQSASRIYIERSVSDSSRGLTGCLRMLAICTLKYQGFHGRLIGKIEPFLICIVHYLQVLGGKGFVYNISCHNVVAKIDRLSVADPKRPIVQWATQRSPNARPLSAIPPCLKGKLL